jgi:succinyl-diaminopimelate desuccinylase
MSAKSTTTAITTPHATNAAVSDELLAHAKALIAIPSTADRPKELRRALDYIAAILAIHPGITVERFEKGDKPSLLAYYGPTRPARFKVLLNGHLDVIPGSPTQFTPRIHDGRLYGRGALDMKVSVLTLTQVFCEMAPQVPYGLGFQVTTDEEIGGHCGTAYQREQGVAADFLVAGERTGLDIATAAKGVCWVTVKARGKSEHGAYPWRGDNALTKLTSLAEKLSHIYPVPKEETWVTTLNIGGLRTTNTVFNRIPDEAEIDLDFRYVHDDPHFATKDSVRTFINSLLPVNEVHFVNFDPSVWVDPTDSYVTQLQAAIESVKGTPVQLLRRPASSDLRHYAGDANARPVECGLDGDDAHGDGEYLELASVPIFQEAFRRFLQNLSA